ncbi:uncharacterized protein (DUF362 family) [Anaerosolibacter carboniphilus]|uniref:Uncharacterized protein (DUF362 family) n=1 Tax=Anaerosolibacter carboniphilus TaxID=1417629 RepID=A0A841KR22_9FIRM|nr:DUF362 domain-containing protein [Anaerosolibacter carboniphilus]MBB6215867.1 uncharacterized protein (DUF362 family) [Anaerosolibacter carboniphilus]
MKNAVVVTPAKKLNYMHNYVVLPYDYGRAPYFNRLDVKAIREAVYQSLDTLDRSTGFKARFTGKKVLVKPNLVGVMRKACYSLGYDIPQTTDPRVFEAVISYLSELNCDITIGEGSGGGMTRAYFKETGYDRIARHYGTKIIPFEEQPIDRYYISKAEVQKEVFIPRIISEVVHGKMLYVSVPKMKTNLYTEVTLGFKNAMGTLAQNMRYRNHTWQINKKLTDLLYLFRPDLTVIDGIIGGEGLTPGPVDPVKVGTIVTGTNSVEVDRVVTRMMGFDPEKNELMIEAVKRGFGDPNVEIIGVQKITKFRSADCSLLSDRFKNNWPNIKMYIGHTNSRAPRVCDIHSVSPEMVVQIEQSCRGGCLATLAMNFEMFLRAKNANTQFSLGVVIGDGVESNGKRFWFDSTGKPYDIDDLKKLNCKKICVGSCSHRAAGACDIFTNTCGNVSELTTKLLKLTKLPLPVLSMENEGLPLIIVGMIQKYFAVRKIVKAGDVVDIPMDAFSDKIFEPEYISEEDKKKDWIYIPMKHTPEQIKNNLKNIKAIPL